jgi:hypothetical protein
VNVGPSVIEEEVVVNKNAGSAKKKPTKGMKLTKKRKQSNEDEEE